MLVFLSCAFTVFILRLHYTTPLKLRSKFNQLPHYVKIFLFEFLAPIIFIKIDRPKVCSLEPSKSSNQNEKIFRKILKDLQEFNHPIRDIIPNDKIQTREQNLIIEEWKMAALILDR